MLIVIPYVHCVSESFSRSSHLFLHYEFYPEAIARLAPFRHTLPTVYATSYGSAIFFSIVLKGHCIEFKYYADGIHSGLTPPVNNSGPAGITKTE